MSEEIGSMSLSGDDDKKKAQSKTEDEAKKQAQHASVKKAMSHFDRLKQFVQPNANGERTHLSVHTKQDE